MHYLSVLRRLGTEGSPAIWVSKPEDADLTGSIERRKRLEVCLQLECKAFHLCANPTAGVVIVM